MFLSRKGGLYRHCIESGVGGTGDQSANAKEVRDVGEDPDRAGGFEGRSKDR